MNIESANTQHPVPQNVMDVEFKLVGDLTIRQFSYLCFFSVLVFVVYNIHLPFIFSYPIMGILILMGLGFAFVPLNDITLDKWAVNYVRAITNPRVRVWKHKNRMPYYFTFESNVQRKSAKNYGVQILGNVNKKKSLEELLSASDMHNQITVAFSDTSDIELKEKEFIEKIGMHSIKSREIVSDEAVFVRENMIQDEMEVKTNFVNVATQNSEKRETRDEKRDEESYQKHLKELEELKKKVRGEIEKQETREKKLEIRVGKLDKKLEVEIKDEKLKNQKTEEGLKEKEAPIAKEATEVKIEAPKPKSSIFADLFEKLTANNSKKIIVKKTEEENMVGILGEERDANAIREQIKKQKGIANNQFLLKGQTVDETGKIVTDVIVIVKNKGGEPLRAMKSNSLGVFDSVTPIAIDEEYILEGDKTNYVFEPVSLKASLKPENLVKLIGKPVLEK